MDGIEVGRDGGWTELHELDKWTGQIAWKGWTGLDIGHWTGWRSDGWTLDKVRWAG